MESISMSDIDKLRDAVFEIYRVSAGKVPYHGWHHVNFVAEKAALFLTELGADETLTVAAAYVHDFNYLFPKNSAGPASRDLRREVLGGAGFSQNIISRVEQIILEARMSRRHAHISAEAKALSDGDTAYKALPIAPLMTVDYLFETGATLAALAQKIVREQTPLADQGIYFYSTLAREAYGPWAEANLQMWTRVLHSLDDADIDTISAQRWT
jgi:uncharacterized protein